MNTCNVRGKQMDIIDIDTVMMQCKKAIIKSSFRVTIDVIIELLCLAGFVSTLFDKSDTLSFPIYYFVLPFLYLGVVYLRIQLMVRGIKFCKYIKFGEILYADVIYLQTWSGRPSKAQIEYEYVYGGNKYVAKDICRYNERDFLKLDFHEQVIRPDNAQIPIVIYKQKSLAFFQYIGIYEDLYFGKAFHFGSI